MSKASAMTIAAILAAVLIGCGGDGGAASGGGAASSGSEEELKKRWGPTEMPDQAAQPLEFLYWRVDGLFDREDLNQDGRLSADEYTGESANFDRLDANSDGFLTKKEIIDDNIGRMREEGQIP